MRSVFVAGVFCAFASAAPSDYKFEEREAVHHAFSKDGTLDVDLVSGGITVVADGGDNIRVDGEKVIRAATQSELDRGKREVVLDINEKDGVAQLYANGPFRDNSNRSENHGFHEHSERRYDVTFNLIAHVPRDVSVHLATVNGQLKAEGTSGAFDLRGVNGAIIMTDVAGSGTVNTLNGPVVVTFRENPKTASYFKSFNGRVDVSFMPVLNADMGFKTYNGQAYTDFESTNLASVPATSELKNGKHVYRTNDFRHVRVGSGGPELKFESFNGDIHIAKRKR